MELNLVRDLTLVLIVAVIGGAVAFRLGQPLVLGYLVAGALVGPYALGLVSDVQPVQVLAEIGVAFLMFALGVEFSIASLRRVRDVALVGGAAQILLSVGLGMGIGALFGFGLLSALFFGCIIALSSTTIVLKVLLDRGELDTLHGRIMLGLLIVQDLSVVPMLVVLPALADPGQNLLLGLLLALVKGGAFLTVMMVLGTRFIPLLMRRVAETRSRELFLLAIIGLALGTAVGTYLLGLSLALGAFMAGLVVSESDFSHEILGEVAPLRDAFAVLFFASIGMLFNPAFVLENLGMIVAIVAAVVLGKFVITAAVTRCFRYAAPVAVAVGLGLVQVGEFSFVIARMGVDWGILPNEIYWLTIAVALLTALLTPAAVTAAPHFSSLLGRFPILEKPFGQQPLVSSTNQTSLSGHTVILGYGRTGRELASVLRTRGFKFFAIDYDPHVIDRLRQEGVPCVYGDASLRSVLLQANLPRARVLVVTIPNLLAAERAVRTALEINPNLDIVVRAEHPLGTGLLRVVDEARVVDPRFEASLEIIRHTMLRLGLSSPEAQYLINRLRQTYIEQGHGA